MGLAQRAKPICFNFVGVTRLELATSRPPDAYSNQLSYTPISEKRCKVKALFPTMQAPDCYFCIFLHSSIPPYPYRSSHIIQSCDSLQQPKSASQLWDVYTFSHSHIYNPPLHIAKILSTFSFRPPLAAQHIQLRRTADARLTPHRRTIHHISHARPTIGSAPHISGKNQGNYLV